MDHKDIFIATLAMVASSMLNIFPHAHITTESEKQSWEQVRARGRDRFILICVFRQGLCFGAALFVAGFLIVSLLTFDFVWSLSSITVLSVFSVMQMLVAGAHYASRTWREREKDYQDLEDRNHA